jgi:hypothetical protein
VRIHAKFRASRSLEVAEGSERCSDHRRDDTVLPQCEIEEEDHYEGADQRAQHISASQIADPPQALQKRKLAMVYRAEKRTIDPRQVAPECLGEPVIALLICSRNKIASIQPNSPVAQHIHRQTKTARAGLAESFLATPIGGLPSCRGSQPRYPWPPDQAQPGVSNGAALRMGPHAYYC